MARLSNSGRTFVGAFVMMLLATPVLAAQDAGTIEGTVRATGSGTPLSDVVVLVQGTTRGGMTDAQGKYRIAAVPVGDRVVMARLIGRARGERAIHLAADSVARIDFSLAEVAAVIAPTVVSATREVQ